MKTKGPPEAAQVQRVQKVQRVQRVMVGGCAANLYKTKHPPYGRGKCTPSAAFGGSFPGGGGFSGAFHWGAYEFQY